MKNKTIERISPTIKDRNLLHTRQAPCSLVSDSLAKSKKSGSINEIDIASIKKKEEALTLFDRAIVRIKSNIPIQYNIFLKELFIVLQFFKFSIDFFGFINYCLHIWENLISEIARSQVFQE